MFLCGMLLVGACAFSACDIGNNSSSAPGSSGGGGSSDNDYPIAAAPYYEKYPNWSVYQYFSMHMDTYPRFLEYYQNEFCANNEKDFYFVELDKIEEDICILAYPGITIYNDGLNGNACINPKLKQHFTVLDRAYGARYGESEEILDGDRNYTADMTLLTVGVEKTATDEFTFEFGEYSDGEYANIYIGEQCIATLYCETAIHYQTGERIVLPYSWIETFFTENIYKGE